MDTNAVQARLERTLGYLEQDEANFPLLSEAADLSLQLRDWAGARPLVERALALQPEDAVTRYRMAVILLQEQKPEDALLLTAALLEAGHTHPAVRFEHARGLAMMARFKEAEPFFAGLLSEADNFAELPYLYIRSLHHQGKLDEAIAFAQERAAAKPNDGILNGMLSLLHLDNGDVVQANALSAKALERAPNNLDALVTAGSAALAYEKEAEAKAHFDKAISLHAASGRAWAGLGLVNMLGLNLPAARSDFEKAVEFMPRHLGSYNALAWIQILQDDFAAARKTLEASLEVDRTFGETHGGLAVLAALEDDWDAAKKLAETAVRLQPDSFSGRFAESLIMTHRGYPERAREMVDMMFRKTEVTGGGNLQDALQRFATRKTQQQKNRS